MFKPRWIAYFITGCSIGFIPDMFVGCSPNQEPIDDTRFEMRVKMVDGSWTDIVWILPSTTKFDIKGSDGTYYLQGNSRDDARYAFRLKTAVIDYEIKSRTLILDTTATRIKLPDQDTLPEL